MIELKEIHKSFGSKQILKDVNLSIKPRQTVVLFGPSGSGKTLLMKICLGLIKPDKGQIRIASENIENMKDAELTKMRLKTGVLFQYYALFDSMTVEENVGFYLKNHSKLSPDDIHRKVIEELNLVNMSGNEKLKPVELSGGMQKRVGIARAIIHRPQTIFYDSPTDGLDPITSDTIIDLIKSINLQFGTTSLVISNDMNTAFRLADKMAMILHHHVYFFGTPEEAANSRDPYVYQFIRGLETGPLTDAKNNSS